MSRMTRRIVLLGIAAVPAGCSGLLPAGGAPPQLYTLTPASDFPQPSGPHVSWQLLIDPPVAPAALDTERIALSRSAISVDYFADATWVDRAPLMLQSLLVQSFENSGRIAAVANESLTLRADYILRSALRHFEADYGGAPNGPPSAHLQISAQLVKMPERAIVARRNFEATVPAAENRVPTIIRAFEAATQQALRKIVDWTLDAGR